MLSINLKQLEVLEAVVEHNSFTEAAAELYLSQSTVSSHIGGLERALGVQIFDRTAKKKIVLTEEGRAVFQQADQILELCREMTRSAADPAELFIGASSIAAHVLVPRLLVNFNRHNPDCQFILKKGDSSTIQNLVKTGEIQVGFVGTVLDRPSLIYDKVAEDELVMITANSTRFRELQSRGIYGTELLEQPIIFRELGSGTQRTVDQYLSRIGADSHKIRVVARMESPEAIQNAVASGLGVSIISELAARKRIEDGDVLRFRLDREGLFREIYMVYRKRGQLSALTEKFIDFVKG